MELDNGCCKRVTLLWIIGQLLKIKLVNCGAAYNYAENSSPATDPSAVHVAGAEKGQEQLSIPVFSVDDSAPSTSNLQPDEVAACQDPLTCQGSVVPVSGSCQMVKFMPFPTLY